MIYYYDYTYKFCNLIIAEENGRICNVSFKIKKNTEDWKKNETPIIKKAAKQFNDYFNGKLKVFDLPLALHGTVFQLKIWNALQVIPYGETRSYGQLAAMIENPKASRAAGMANNRNPAAIIIPCHRIIGHDGSLTGYAGGLELKQQLLNLEKENSI
ncbi:MAG: methylated-DNA--[protein]-cysteine S-methyltransferase [Treponema sp.]|nr:methylated-DNA--[protein]-cysteine S-methyltransferase [Treponema sp.]